ncbi:hypothetical protein AVEN_232106-1 [Araneus ventricosus]|uniref:Uncharacterized protein n=1 Tax=Araneus ventricosus TaxID=182803 RepID=A0A4Y2FSU1_ARAVE|nr:hypothetical protein AVEN_232106-1 [Araneus ventricosus]
MGWGNHLPLQSSTSQHGERREGPDGDANLSSVGSSVKDQFSMTKGVGAAGVIFRITIFNETELELDLKDLYEINVSSNAAPFSRIIQLSVAALHYKFQLDIGVKNYDWLGITERSGIVYIEDPRLMPQPSTVRRGINWFFKNDTHSKKGSILLLLTIQEDFPNACAQRDVLKLQDGLFHDGTRNTESCSDSEDDIRARTPHSKIRPHNKTGLMTHNRFDVHHYQMTKMSEPGLCIPKFDPTTKQVL